MITTHVLDTGRGRPAAGVQVSLHRQGPDTWELIGTGITDADGRLKTLMPAGTPLAAGRYRLTFETGGYFRQLGVESFFPEVNVTFEVRRTDQHHHVPLLLSPYGYSTYRGS